MLSKTYGGSEECDMRVTVAMTMTMISITITQSI